MAATLWGSIDLAMIDIFYFTGFDGLDQGAEQELSQSLPDSIMKKISRYRHRINRLQRTVAWRVLQQNTGRRLDDIRLGEFGKPCFPDSACGFGISYSKGIALVAIAGDGEIGADVESMTGSHAGLIDSKSLPFEECVRRKIRDSRNPEDAFLEEWTRYESYFKMRGLGIQENVLWNGEGESADIRTFRLDGHMVSICTNDGDRDYRWHEVKRSCLLPC